MLAADLLRQRSPTAGAVGWTWAALITISCSTTGQHAILDLVAGALLFAPLSYWYNRRRSRAIVERRLRHTI